MRAQGPRGRGRIVQHSSGFGLFAYGSFFNTADSDGGYARQDALELDRLRHARLTALEEGPFKGTERVSR